MISSGTSEITHFSPSYTGAELDMLLSSFLHATRIYDSWVIHYLLSTKSARGALRRRKKLASVQRVYYLGHSQTEASHINIFNDNLFCKAACCEAWKKT